MVLTRILLERFTAFDRLDLEPSPGINVLIGENGTGKTHLMKAAYAACAVTRGREPVFAEKLVRVFAPRGGHIGRLARRRQGVTRARLRFEREGRHLELGFATDDQRADLLRAEGESGWMKRPIRAVYVPVKEFLSHAPGFRSLYAERAIHFDEVYPDLLDRAFLPALRGPRGNVRKRIVTRLEQVLGGHVETKDEEFFLRNQMGKLEFTLVAEGLRKIALLLVLVRNGSLVLDERGEDNVLFWDEPESNLNPRLIRVVVETLLEIARAGTQVFLATHDYVILKELDLQATRGDDVRWHALYFEKNEVRCETSRSLKDIGQNAIAGTFADLYDREIDRLASRPAETV